MAKIDEINSNKELLLDDDFNLPTNKKSFLTKKELNILFQNEKMDDFDKIYLLISFKTGLRVREVLQLIEELKKIFLKKEKQTRLRNTLFKDLSVFTIKLKGSIGINGLQMWNRLSNNEKKYVKNNITKIEKIINYDNVSKRFKRKYSNILNKKITTHSVRRGSAFNLWEKTHDIFKVREFLNHKYISSTEIYLNEMISISIKELLNEELSRMELINDL